MTAQKLVPPPGKGHLSIARLTRAWYVACRSSELSSAPIHRTVLGVPLVLFRGPDGKPRALLDRCPHRNVPLSRGRVVQGGRLECGYHGWQFDGSGRCQLVPGLAGASEERERRVPAAATREQDEFVWVWPELDGAPLGDPYRVPNLGPSYVRVVREVEAPGSLHATLENALDVPHTAFLHRGLFRGQKRNEIRATLRRSADRVEVSYAGEPRPSGVLGRLLSPSGGVVEHWDRFILPSVAEVEYRLGSETHLFVAALGTPVSDFVTRLFAVVSVRSLLPRAVVRPLLEPVALFIFRQDAHMLAAQSDNVRAFGGEQYMSTELDLIGPHIWRLLKQAESGTDDGASPAAVEREVRFFA
jgi:phenylpropionate dioxygenase-like ring-hydroxylating dioxygenase large terminal subunit